VTKIDRLGFARGEFFLDRFVAPANCRARLKAGDFDKGSCLQRFVVEFGKVGKDQFGG